MTYVTGQSIVFVGCGQVGINLHPDPRCLLTRMYFPDLHRFETVESGERCGGDFGRLI